MNELILGDCLEKLNDLQQTVDLTFFDPPFNQNKFYNSHKDNMESQKYWSWMQQILSDIHKKSSDGAAMYFMQREKNASEVITVLRNSGWEFQNMIIWKKKSSAVPSKYRYAKQYQIIVFAAKGRKPRVFNKLRIDPILLVTEKYTRPNGVYLTDVWDDIRELTSGYFAGDEPLRLEDGSRIHNQQSPIELLLRIILSSSNIGDFVLDPFAGTGTTNVVAKQLNRDSISIEKDPENYQHIKNRISGFRRIDLINRFRNKYNHTENLDEIWPPNELYDIIGND